MKTTIYIIGAALLVVAVLSAPVDDSKTATILRSENENNGLGEYKFGFETSDGTKRDEEGALKNVGTETEALSVRGTISWVAPDGQTYSITFLADENGYQPEGAHIPK